MVVALVFFLVVMVVVVLVPSRKASNRFIAYLAPGRKISSMGGIVGSTWRYSAHDCQLILGELMIGGWLSLLSSAGVFSSGKSVRNSGKSLLILGRSVRASGYI